MKHAYLKTVHLNILNRFTGMLVAALLLSGCSMGSMVVRGTESIMDSSVDAMNRETDLELAREAMPTNLKLLEGMLIEEPGNTTMRIYAAQGFYGYAYGFIEAEDPLRAAQIYRRCYEHARIALAQAGVNIDPEAATPAEFEAVVSKAGQKAVPALFWSSTCLSNWINMNRDRPTGIAELSTAATMMQRVLELDETFYYGGAHMFFGVYYGGRSPMFGGNYALSEQHFERAAEINDNKLLLVDLLYAEYLSRQKLDRVSFHDRLTHVIDAPVDLYPEMALVNEIARVRAERLLEHESDWF